MHININPNHLDIDYIEQLYKKNISLLVNYANIVLSNNSLAEEAVQETFIIVCIKYSTLVDSPNPEGWIMNTLKNVCKNIQKSRNYYLTKILPLSTDIQSNHNYDSTDFIELNVENIVSPEDFILLKKTILYGYSYKDLAKEINISLEACKKRVQRAKQRFRKNYEKIYLTKKGTIHHESPHSNK